jgi:hypothetical protein
MQRYHELAETLESFSGVETAEVTNRETEQSVYVSLECHHVMDKVITAAYDRGFTPNGVTELPAMRFKPRQESETEV